MGVYLPFTPRLPSTYQEVEYIESSGTQYINTLYTPSVNTEIETDIQWGTQSTSWAAFFGVTGNDSSADGILGRIYSSTSTNFNPWFCNATYGERQITTTINAWHNIVLKSGSCNLDGTSYTITTSSTPYQSSIDLFAGNNGGTHGWRASQCAIKTFKIYESGTLVRDFVPCYRKSDSVIGLYDLVNSVFYTNAGTGTFSKGADVIAMPLKNAYIGEYTEGRQPGANTVAYRPLNSTTTVNDQSGNNYNLTNTGSVTFGTYKGVDCAYFSGSNKLTTTSFVSNQQAVTVSCWVYFIRNGYSNNGNYNQFVRRWGGSSANFGPYYENNTSTKKIVCSPGGIGTKTPTSDSSRMYITVTFNGSNTIKMYMNGVLDGTNSSGTVPSGSRIGVGGYTANNTNVRKGGISEVIVENKVRTDQEIADYYNRKKSNYGL